MSTDNIVHWNVRSFGDLTVGELHDLLKLREDIFVVEQGCAYHEIDGRDPSAWHVLGTNTEGLLVAYARILPAEPGGLPHIGRVVVRKDHRGRGHAHGLMHACLSFLQERFGSSGSELAAQAHLERFYGGFGYRKVSEPYDWDGIPHIDMRLSAPA